MKKLLFCLMCAFIAMPVNAAPRRSATLQLNKQMLGRSAAVQTGEMKVAEHGEKTVADIDEQSVETPKTDETDARRATCLANNIGGRDIFVWAASDSNTDNYSTMVEDTTNPENNVCFALVKVQTNDVRVDLADIPGKYFPMGQRITCGNWVDGDMLKKRILDGKKSARVWATVAGSVGGAGLGVGIMELGGNKALAAMGVKSVQGQKALSGDELFLSQLKVLKKDKDSRYATIVDEIKQIKKGCEKNKIPECDDVDYNKILSGLNEQ